SLHRTTASPGAQARDFDFCRSLPVRASCAESGTGMLMRARVVPERERGEGEERDEAERRAIREGADRAPSRGVDGRAAYGCSSNWQYFGWWISFHGTNFTWLSANRKLRPSPWRIRAQYWFQIGG